MTLCCGRDSRTPGWVWGSTPTPRSPHSSSKHLWHPLLAHVSRRPRAAGTHRHRQRGEPLVVVAHGSRPRALFGRTPHAHRHGHLRADRRHAGAGRGSGAPASARGLRDQNPGENDMTRFRNTVTIDRPIDEVFRFVANFENMSKWNYFSLVMRFTLATGTSTSLTDEWEVGVGSGLLGVLGFLAAGR